MKNSFINIFKKIATLLLVALLVTTQSLENVYATTEFIEGINQPINQEVAIDDNSDNEEDINDDKDSNNEDNIQNNEIINDTDETNNSNDKDNQKNEGKSTVENSSTTLNEDAEENDINPQADSKEIKVNLTFKLNNKIDTDVKGNYYIALFDKNNSCVSSIEKLDISNGNARVTYSNAMDQNGKPVDFNYTDEYYVYILELKPGQSYNSRYDQNIYNILKSGSRLSDIYKLKDYTTGVKLSESNPSKTVDIYAEASGEKLQLKTLNESLGIAKNFGAFTNLFKQSADIESNIAAGEAIINNDYNFSDNNIKIANNKIIATSIYKDNNSPVENEKIEFRLYKKADDKKILIKTITEKTNSSGEATVTFDVLIGGTYYVYEVINGEEVRQSGSIEISDTESINVNVTDNENIEIDTGYDNYSYFNKVTNFGQPRGNSTVVIEDQSSYDKYFNSYGDKSVDIIKAGTNGFDIIDFASEFAGLSSLSKNISTALPSDDIKVIYLDYKDLTSNLNIQDEGKYVVVNVDMSNAPSSYSWPGQYKINGSQVSSGWDKESTKILWNFYDYNSNKPYDGEISIGGTTSGILLVPNSTVNSASGNHVGTIIADIINHTTGEIHFVKNINSQEKNVNFINEKGSTLDKGQISIEKVDEDDKATKLSGAKFGIYTDEKCETEALEILETQGDGTSKSKELSVGTYYVKEIKAPQNYELDSTIYNVVINSDGQVVNVGDQGYVTNRKARGSIEITKIDIVTNETLPNTKIVIKDKNGDVVREGITDENGKVVFEKLAVGKYTYQEKEAPEGYIVDKNEFSFEIKEDDEIIKETMKNAKEVSLFVKKNLLNQSQFTDGETFEISIKGQFSDESTEQTITFTKDEALDGIRKEVKNVVYGNTYEISEKNADKYNVTIANDGQIQVMNKDELVEITNSKLVSGQLTVTKNVENLSTVADDEVFVLTVDGKFSDERTSKEIYVTKDKIGQPIVVPNTIYGQTYTLTEKINDNYYVTYDKKTATVGGVASISTLSVTNTRKESGGLEVIKNLSQGSNMSDDDKFVIKVTGKFSDTSDTVKKFTFTKDDIGKVKSVAGVIYGESYTITEQNNDKYTAEIENGMVIIGSKKQTVTVTNTKKQTQSLSIIKSANTKVVGDGEEFTIKVTGKFSDINNGNTVSTKKIKFNKAELNTAKIVSGVIYGETYEISEDKLDNYTSTIDKEKVTIKDRAETVTVKNTRKSAGKLEVVKSLEEGTKASGDDKFTILVSGVFSDKEGTTIKELTFTSDNIGKPQEVSGVIYGNEYTITEQKSGNKYVLDSIENKKVTMGSEDILSTVTNRKAVGSIEITKIDIVTEETLPNTRIVIKDENGDVVREGITDENGKVTFEKLVVGKYTYQEKEAPEGYVIDKNEYPFEIKEDGQIITKQITNDYTKVEISKKDITTKEELPGAKLQVKDSQGKVVEEWVSTDKPHMINRLPVGDYILVEIIAPDGYTKAKDIHFTVLETGEIQRVEMFDSKVIPNKPNEGNNDKDPSNNVDPNNGTDNTDPNSSTNDTVKTGDKGIYFELGILLIAALLIGTIRFNEDKKKHL